MVMVSKAEEGIRHLISEAGVELSEVTNKTPARVVRAFREMTGGYAEDPRQILSTVEPNAIDGLVVVSGISFTSLCAHHLLPFWGTAAVGYIPKGRVVGLSKIARLVECRARRLQLQESLTREIAEDLKVHLQPKGVGVVITAQHACMCCRGVRQGTATTTTTTWLGGLRDRRQRAEFLSAIDRP